jgi:hypothetical protein
MSDQFWLDMLDRLLNVPTDEWEAYLTLLEPREAATLRKLVRVRISLALLENRGESD